jgi:serine/threonine protein kinase/tetratricopeptide (TPR) repeat protein
MKPDVARSLARVRVGSFELNLHSGELRSHLDETVLLREQPFQVLRMLVEREGKLVTRSEIKERLWPNDTIVDFDHSINVAIGVLRRAFGDSAATPRYIETLARRGYRLIVRVEWLQLGPHDGKASVIAKETRQLGDLTGKKVCQYRVLEVLGGGGMGMVYKAEDLKLGRRAALKFLPEELAGDPIALQRLEREAQTASALNHPNICTIYDIEEHEGQPFIAMELLEGETLQQRLAACAPGAMPAPLMIDIAIQVCLGLDAAHSKTIVHRDVKPANIFLTKEGTAKLLDFGIAKLAAGDNAGPTDETQPAPHSKRQEDLTRIGVAVGTSGYMSPEQVRREELDGRSDLFSLGLVLYEMATGLRAFTGDTAVAVQEAILNATPPAVESLNGALPRALSRVVARALEKDRSHRHQTATEMRHDLERARAALVPQGTHRLRRGLSAAAVLSIAAVAAWLWPRGGVALAPSDTIVIAHLTNATGDRVFDEALYTALRISLEQTPYLNVLADNKVVGTLASLKLDAVTRITPEVALQVCRQTGSRVVVAPSIADAGNRLRLELKGIDCRSGSSITVIANEAASRDDVVGALGISALQLREVLGEPASSIAKYDAPLPEATSRSPEALELLTQGYRRQLDGSVVAAIPLYQRAVQADRNLALAHAALSSAYGNVGEVALSEAAGRTAFDMRERLTAPGRFSIESNYYSQVLGDIEAACAVRAQWVALFPHDVIARNNFALCLSVLGEPDRALGESREVARLLPAAFTYRAWILRAMLADRLDEAESTIDDALQRGFDTAALRDLQVGLAFLRNDTAAMQEQWDWAAGRAGADDVIMGRALVEATHGRFRAALRSVNTGTAMMADKREAVADATEVALMQAEAGVAPAVAISVAPSETFRTRLLGALALARAGRLEQARQAADALRREFPSNTILQKYGLPLIDGAVMLQSGDAGAALAVMKATNRDLAYTAIFQPLYPAYIRGLAYLQAGDPNAAATEFQKLIRRPGLLGRGVIGPLAGLQLARAQSAMGDTAAAIGSYEVFLDRWRDADADVPVYAAARAEYERLRTSRSSK